MLMITLSAEQKKRQRFIERSFRLYGRRRGWDVSREQHRNMHLLFKMLYRLVTTFIPRSKCLLISWLRSPSVVILEPPEMKSVTVSIIFPSICHEEMGLDAMILVFWMLSFNPTFLLSSFTFIKRLFIYSFLSAIREVSSAYLRLLIFLPEILIPACASSGWHFSWCTLHIS